jgi:hypothetical protein
MMGTMYVLAGFVLVQMPPLVDVQSLRDTHQMCVLQQIIEEHPWQNHSSRRLFQLSVVEKPELITSLRKRGLTENDIGLMLMRSDHYRYLISVLERPENVPSQEQRYRNDLGPILVAPWPPNSRYHYPPNPNAEPFKSPKKP